MFEHKSCVVGCITCCQYDVSIRSLSKRPFSQLSLCDPTCQNTDAGFQHCGEWDPLLTTQDKWNRWGYELHEDYKNTLTRHKLVHQHVWYVPQTRRLLHIDTPSVPGPASVHLVSLPSFLSVAHTLSNFWLCSVFFSKKCLLWRANLWLLTSSAPAIRSIFSGFARCLFASGKNTDQDQMTHKIKWLASSHCFTRTYLGRV